MGSATTGLPQISNTKKNQKNNNPDKGSDKGGGGNGIAGAAILVVIFLFWCYQKASEELKEPEFSKATAPAYTLIHVAVEDLKKLPTIPAITASAEGEGWEILRKLTQVREANDFVFPGRLIERLIEIYHETNDEQLKEAIRQFLGNLAKAIFAGIDVSVTHKGIPILDVPHMSRTTLLLFIFFVTEVPGVAFDPVTAATIDKLVTSCAAFQTDQKNLKKLVEVLQNIIRYSRSLSGFERMEELQKLAETAEGEEAVKEVARMLDVFLRATMEVGYLNWCEEVGVKPAPSIPNIDFNEYEELQKLEKIRREAYISKGN